MDDYSESAIKQATKKKRRKSNTGCWNVLTAIIFFVTLVFVIIFVLILKDPQTAINPYKPPTVPAPLALPTSTATLYSLPSTWTPTNTLEPTETRTPQVEVTVNTPVIIISPGSLVTVTVTPTRSASAYGFSYEASGDPSAVSNTLFHADGTCNWQGIAGHVVDFQGQPVIGMFVQLGGYYDGKVIETTTLTGGATWYGDSGYEFVLGTKPLDTYKSLWVQLTDQAYLPLSDRVYLDTFSACTKNLILINFKQIRP
jgi:hypothetical protein